MARSGEYISVTQAREILGVSEPRIAQMIRNGELHAEKNPVDRRGKLLKRSEVEALAAKLPKKDPLQPAA